MNPPDNYDMFVAEERRKQQMLDRLPVCHCCTNPIQQEKAVHICGMWFCDQCLTDEREDIEL